MRAPVSGTRPEGEGTFMGNATLGRSTARLLERRHVTRTGMTRVGVLAAIGAAVWFSREGTAGALIGSAFLAVILLCDAVRSHMETGRRDALTSWLATMLDQLCEYIVYIGLVLGAVSAGSVGVWGWAAGALIALALRDSLLIARSAPAAAEPASGAAGGPASFPGRPEGLFGRLLPRPPGRAEGGSPELTGKLLGAQRPSVPRSCTPVVAGRVPPGAPAPLPALFRRVLAFPQPVRFSAIAVTTVVADARIAFVTLIIGCAVAVTGELVDPIDRGARP